ncbi:MAG: hypothetical protein CBB97_11345 [Candidatus Endolissoclinum sp. TMED37]|nr:MAG: hypothetical protein CBB97_11345 [Candidatus Endolissoclinum sp. TMED37]|tara:strand:- start:1827 stop:2183 length:357 start_codon:yes stop_codon:yes gene_type:complete
MSTVIKPKRSETAASVPAGSDLEAGEIAINLADKKLYSKTTGGTVTQIGGMEVKDGDEDSVAVDVINFVDTIEGVFNVDTTTAPGNAIVRVQSTTDRDYGFITDAVDDFAVLDLGGLT